MSLLWRNITDFIGKVYSKLPKFLLIKVLFSIALIPIVLTIFGIATYQLSKWVSKEELFFSVAQTLTVKTFGENSYIEYYIEKLRDQVLYDPVQFNVELAKKTYLLYSSISPNAVHAIEENSTISPTNKKFLIHLHRDLLNLKYDMMNGKFEQNLSGIVDKVRLIVNENKQLPHECMEHELTNNYIYLPLRSTITEGRMLSKSITVEDLSREIQKDDEIWAPSHGNMKTFSVIGLGSEYASILTDQIKANCK